MNSWAKFLGLFLFFGLPFLSTSKYIEGELDTLENWAFIARFCFLSEEGRYHYSIEYRKELGIQNLLLYYDTDDQWPAVYKSNKTCRQKEAVMVEGNNQVIQLSPRLPFVSGCSEDDEGNVRCQNERRFRSARERWWFLAVSNCNATKGINMQFKFLMTNGHPEDYWRYHFSADEFYILPLLLAFFFVYVALLFAVLIFAVELRARQLLHTTYKQFAASVALQTAGIALQAFAFARFASDGVGLPSIKELGRFLEAASETVFLLLLLLLAQGYTVTRGRIKLGAAVRLTAFMCLYCAAQMALFAWESRLFDAGEVLYLYESPVGHGLAGLRLVAWARALLSVAQTLARGAQSKVRFYKRFAVLAALWFISNPIMVLAASLWIDKWVRETAVCGAAHAIALLGHLSFCVLTRPSRANANFPYHVRTSQVGVATSREDSECSFREHVYAPSALTGGLKLGGQQPQGYGQVYGQVYGGMNNNNDVSAGPPRPPTASTGGDWAAHVPLSLFTVSHAISLSETTPAAADGMINSSAPTRNIQE